MAKRCALVTGVTGQDGSYLARFLLEKEYRVVGLVRRSSTDNLSRIAAIAGDLDIEEGDMTDQSSLTRTVQLVKPDEVYNLAAQSFVGTSWQQPEMTANVTALGALRCLEAIRGAGLPGTRFYQASSSEMFGKVEDTPQTEKTLFYPRSPYGVSKLFAHWLTVNYRESYSMFAVSGILFNHESPVRGIQFVTRKITRAAARIKQGRQDKLALGNLDARRDWGHAKDYVRAMWMMLQNETPQDYVVATGETHTVQDFCEAAFGRVGLNWQDHVEIDEQFLRPADVDTLCGDSSRIREDLGWKPAISFEDLVKEMVDCDMVEVSRLPPEN